MPQFIPLFVDWSTHTKLDTSSLPQSTDRKEDGLEVCRCEFCGRGANHDEGWRCLSNPQNANIFITGKGDFGPITIPERPLKKLSHTKSNRILSLDINYTGNTPTDMSMILTLLPQYSSWTGILELIIHPGASRKEAPRLYSKKVLEIKALIRKINQSLPQIQMIRCQFIIDYFSLSQLRLAAGLIDLNNKDWTLAYVEASDKDKIIDIYKKDSIFKRIESVYREEFAK